MGLQGAIRAQKLTALDDPECAVDVDPGHFIVNVERRAIAGAEPNR